jgi:hypothetical protein
MPLRIIINIGVVVNYWYIPLTLLNFTLVVYYSWNALSKDYNAFITVTFIFSFLGFGFN